MDSAKGYLYRRIVRAKLHIDQHFQQEIDLDAMAGAAHYSKFHFIRLFREIYGFTPARYLTAKRLDFASERLRENSTVTEACFAAGFQSMGSFSSAFKAKTGLSPSDFRAAQQRMQEAQSANPTAYIPGCFLQNRNLKEAPDAGNAEIHDLSTPNPESK